MSEISFVLPLMVMSIRPNIEVVARVHQRCGYGNNTTGVSADEGDADLERQPNHPVLVPEFGVDVTLRFCPVVDHLNAKV